MHRLLRELDRVDAGGRVRSRGSQDFARKAVAVVVGSAIVAVVSGMFAYKEFGITLTAEGLQRKAPLNRPPGVMTGLGAVEFLMRQPTDETRPVAYDPCREIEFEVNNTLAPPSAERIVTDALVEVEHATGLVFRHVGRTDRLPDSDGPTFGRRSEPVLIAWATPDQVPDLSGDVAGIGGSGAGHDSYTGELRYVTGIVALDAPQLTQVLARPDGAAQVQAVVMHELGHLVGLDHVSDPNELMFDENVGRLGFGPGDLEGLAALGSQRCYL